MKQPQPQSQPQQQLQHQTNTYKQSLFKKIIHHSFLWNYLIKSIKVIHSCHKFTNEKCTEVAKVYKWNEVIEDPRILLKYEYFDLYQSCTNQMIMKLNIEQRIAEKSKVFWNLLDSLSPQSNNEFHRKHQTDISTFLRPWITGYLYYENMTQSEWTKLFSFVLQLPPIHVQDSLQIENNRLEREKRLLDYKTHVILEENQEDETKVNVEEAEEEDEEEEEGLENDDDEDEEEMELEKEDSGGVGANTASGVCGNGSEDRDGSKSNLQGDDYEDRLIDERDDIKLFGELGDVFAKLYPRNKVIELIKSFHFGDYVGDVEKFKYLEKNGVIYCTTLAMDNAAKRGDLEMVKYLQSNRTEGCTHEGLGGAIENAHMDVIDFILGHQVLRGHGCHNDAFERASAKGHLEVFKYFHRHYPHDRMWRAGTYMDQAARHGHLSLLKFLHSHRTDYYSLRSSVDLERTIENCRGDTLRQKSIESTALFLMEHRQDSLAEPRILSSALKRGSMVLIEKIWSCNRLCDRKSTNDYLLDAVVGNNVEAVQFIHTNHPFATLMLKQNQLMVTAARNGNIDILSYLCRHRSGVSGSGSQDNGFNLEKDDAEYIIKNQPQVVKYFKSNPSSLSKTSHQLIVNLCN